MRCLPYIKSEQSTKKKVRLNVAFIWFLFLDSLRIFKMRKKKKTIDFCFCFVFNDFLIVQFFLFFFFCLLFSYVCCLFEIGFMFEPNMEMKFVFLQEKRKKNNWKWTIGGWEFLLLTLSNDNSHLNVCVSVWSDSLNPHPNLTFLFVTFRFYHLTHTHTKNKNNYKMNRFLNRIVFVCVFFYSPWKKINWKMRSSKVLIHFWYCLTF